MRLQGRVVIALVVEPVLADVISGSKTGLHLTKFVVHGLVDIAKTCFVVDLHLGMGQGLVNAHQRWQYLVLDLDQPQGLVKDIWIERRDSRHRITYIAHLVDGQRVLVLAGRQDTKLLRQVLTCQNGYNARQR